MITQAVSGSNPGNGCIKNMANIFQTKVKLKTISPSPPDSDTAGDPARSDSNTGSVHHIFYLMKISQIYN